MMTVRFATGFSVQYNDANFIHYGDHTHQLRDRKDGNLIATVPASAIVELVPPCRIYNAVRDETTETIRGLVQSEFKTIQRQIRALKKSK